MDHVWSAKECACCACDLSVHLSVPSIGFLYVLYVGSSLHIKEFQSWITGVSSHYVVSLWSGKSLQLLCILPFGMVCLSAISMMFVKFILSVCILVGMMG